jgi:hypothetical protein
MHDIDMIGRALLALAAFAFGLAGHYIGDQWLQTHGQACKKSLGGDSCRRVAMWHCAKHVLVWTATVTVFVVGAGWWLHLPMKPGWLAAGMAVNAITHFVADLRTPLIWIACRFFNRAAYIDYVNVVRASGTETVGPGTAVFHLDQSWHIAWLAVSALVIAGPM